MTLGSDVYVVEAYGCQFIEKLGDDTSPDTIELLLSGKIGFDFSRDTGCYLLDQFID